MRPASEEPPGHRFETGTPSFEALAGTVAAIGYIASLGDGDLDTAYARIREHEEVLARRVLDRLGRDRRRDAPRPERRRRTTPTFCFTVDGATPRAVSEQLAERSIFTWDGNYYALGLMEALGLEERGGAVRAGFLHYNTAAEADRLCDAVEEIADAGGARDAPRRDEAPA